MFVHECVAQSRVSCFDCEVCEPFVFGLARCHGAAANGRRFIEYRVHGSAAVQRLENSLVCFVLSGLDAVERFNNALVVVDLLNGWFAVECAHGVARGDWMFCHCYSYAIRKR
ncbi:hypothetical protein D3C74_391250 [compost metagenome]